MLRSAACRHTDTAEVDVANRARGEFFMEKRTRGTSEQGERRRWMRAAILVVIGVLVLGATGFIFIAFWRAHLVNSQTEGSLSWTSELVHKENTPGNAGGRAPGRLLS